MGKHKFRLKAVKNYERKKSQLKVAYPLNLVELQQAQTCDHQTTEQIVQKELIVHIPMQHYINSHSLNAGTFYSKLITAK